MKRDPRLEELEIDEELEELALQLGRIPLPVPGDEFMDQLLSRWESESRGPISLRDRVGVLLSHGWLALFGQSLLFYMIGFIWLFRATAQPPLFILPILSSIPFLLGVLHLARWLDHGMLELMMSLRLRLIWHVNACFFLVGVFTLLVNMAFTFLLPGPNWGMMALHWSIPSLFLAGVALWLWHFLPNFNSLMGALASLPILSLAVYGERSTQEFLLGLGLGALLMGLVTALFFFGATAIYTTNQLRGGEFLETRS